MLVVWIPSGEHFLQCCGGTVVQIGRGPIDLDQCRRVEFGRAVQRAPRSDVVRLESRVQGWLMAGGAIRLFSEEDLPASLCLFTE